MRTVARIHRLAVIGEKKDDLKGWEPIIDGNKALKITKRAMESVYKRTDKEIKVYSIHAGLECGFIKTAYPNIHAVSIGPTIKVPHSIEEKLHMPSFERTYKVLLKIIEEVGK